MKTVVNFCGWKEMPSQRLGQVILADDEEVIVRTQRTDFPNMPYTITIRRN